MSIFARLNFGGGDYVQPLSNSAIKHINSLPPLMTDWQQKDVADNSTTGYFKNPLITVLNNIKSEANTINAIPNIASTNAISVMTAAVALSPATVQYIGHTNRLSGVDAPNINTITLPHYETAMGVGKIMMYITFQSDGVQNNAPLVGNFSSLYTGNTLNTYYTTIQDYSTLIEDNIYSWTETIDMGEGGSSSTTYYQCNLASSVISTMANTLTEMTTLMNTRRTADVSFFQTSQTIVDQYNTVKSFNNMGQTQTDVIKNLIGSDKLLERLDS